MIVRAFSARIHALTRFSGFAPTFHAAKHPFKGTAFILLIRKHSENCILEKISEVKIQEGRAVNGAPLLRFDCHDDKFTWLVCYLLFFGIEAVLLFYQNCEAR